MAATELHVAGGYQGHPAKRSGWAFDTSKRCLDIAFAIPLAMIFTAMIIPVAMINLGLHREWPIFTQIRMGKGCKPIRIHKFRTMKRERGTPRGIDDPLERDRITPFGKLLRDTHLDEVPQFWNILRGDMSMVGPRPDMFSHAQEFCTTIVGYEDRHRVKPGLTGLAQIGTGYAEGVGDTLRKVRADLKYINNQSLRLDFEILWGTLHFLLKNNPITKRAIATERLHIITPQRRHR